MQRMPSRLWNAFSVGRLQSIALTDVDDPHDVGGDVELAAAQKPTGQGRVAALVTGLFGGGRDRRGFSRVANEEEEGSEEEAEQLLPSVSVVQGKGSSAEGPSGRIPEDGASFLSGLLFSYVYDLVQRGYAKALETQDLWNVSARDRADAVSARFTALLEMKGSVGGAVWSMFGGTFVAMGVLKFFHDCVMMTSPLILEQLLKCLERGTSKWISTAWVVALLANTVFVTLTINYYFHVLFRMSCHLKVCLVSMLYAKSLRISQSVKGERGVGTIVNLQSNDAAKLWSLPQYLHVLWSGPFQIVVVLVMLVRVVHLIPALCGAVTTALLVPLSALVGKKVAAVRKRLMVKTEARVKLCSEVITGVKAIKLYAWEEPYLKKINEVRAEEIREIRLCALIGIINSLAWLGGPILISAASLLTYSALGYPLTAAVAFPALALFNQLRFPVAVFPDQIMTLIQAHVAYNRITSFMESEEMRQPPVQPCSTHVNPVTIEVKDATFSWTVAGPTILHDISFQVPAGSLLVVVGGVGGGKSSLLSALLSEMVCQRGSVSVCGRVTYCAQDAWIQNATLRDNVLMGGSMDEDRYDRVLEACALLPDLDLLPSRDLSEIGEKGITLSGGQRQRVALARAAYDDSDVILMDDPLSAVDAHVGQHLFHRCICGWLAGRTRVLVTHQLQYMASADLIAVVEDGQISQFGTYSHLREQGVDFHAFERTDDAQEDTDNVNKHAVVGQVWSGPPASAEVTGQATDHSAGQLGDEAEAIRSSGFDLNEDDVKGEDDVDADMVKIMGTGPQGSNGMDSVMLDLEFGREWPTGFTGISAEGNGHHEAVADGECTTIALEDEFDDFQAAACTHTRESGAGRSPRNNERTHLSMANSVKLVERGKLVKVEERSVGRVRWLVYRSYIGAWGPCYIVPLAVLVLLLLERGLSIAQNWWLTVWTDATARMLPGVSLPLFYMWVYLALGIFAIGATVLRTVVTLLGSVSASKKMHERLLRKVLRLPMSFFDSQPSGRILNRFTKDMEALDVKLEDVVGTFGGCAASVVGSMLVVLVISPSMVLLVLLLLAMYSWLQPRYVAVSRELKRLDSIATSPVFTSQSETVHGLSTIRAFRRQGAFTGVYHALLDGCTRTWWPAQEVNRWLSVRLELLGGLVVAGTALTATVIQQRSAGLAGLSITSALTLTGMMNWMVRQITELEVNMNSMERLMEYDTYAEEKPAVVATNRPPPNWPQEGSIDVRQLVVKYRPDLDPVLKGVTFCIPGGQKIGIAGRTGCGKSTLMMALYRIVEPTAGQMFIDGVDILKIGLYDLRSRLALVPQDPIIFSGTVRSNLDPFGAAPGDAEIWEALQQSGMASTVRSLEGGLDTPISEGGGNLSTGQRQLLCMSRALLRGSRILVLDEATANVDTLSDSLIQNTIRTAFSSATVLTIAHRLHTIIDCNQVMVLQEGHLAEFDTPSTLMAMPHSLFRGMVESSMAHMAHMRGPTWQRTQSAALLADAVHGMAPTGRKSSS